MRLGDDVTVTTFATMTTTGDTLNINIHEVEEEEDGDFDQITAERNDATPPRKVTSKTVDNFPSSTVTIASGTTADAVRLGDDLTVTTFATLTTVGDAGAGMEEEEEEADDVATSGSVSSSSRLMAAPSAGILRESRHNRPSALRDNRGFRSPTSSITAAPVQPITVGESVSNAHILRAMTDLRFHVDYRIGELREMNRRDSERGETPAWHDV